MAPGTMNSLLSVIPIVARRVGANARLLIAVIVGAILAAALMSTTAIYTDAIRDLGLTYAIRQAGIEKVNISVTSSSHLSLEEAYRADQETIESAAKKSIGSLLSRPITAMGRSETFYPTPPGQPVAEAEDRPRANFQFVTNIEEEIKTAEGRLPADAAFAQGQSLNVQVALGGETARRLGVGVGDRFDLHPFRDPTREPVHITVVGIIDPKDADDVFWFGADDLFSYPREGFETLLFFVTEKTYFKAIGPYLPPMTTDYGRFVYLQTGAMNARNADRIREAVIDFDQAISSGVERTSVSTELPDVLATFDEKLFFTRIPLLVLVLQIAAIVLYYLFMVSTMLVERQSAEIALLKSRGATTAQVMQIYVIEGLGILGIGLAAGPPLAALIISFLGRTPPFTDLSGGTNLHVRLSPDAYLWALGGAVLAFATLLWPAYQATRRTMVQQRTASARPPKQPFFTRYYLDLVLVGIGALLFYQLDRSGQFVSKSIAGEDSIDPVTLMTPAFFILTVGIFFLRLFPIVLRILAWFVARAQGTSILIGMWQLVRNPVHYSRLVLLLMLATAVGMFTASFGATLEKSYTDRASYQSGGKLQLANMQRATTISGPSNLTDELREQLGASEATPLLRTTAAEGATTNRFGFDLLGIDPATFADVAYFREDFADASLSTLLDELASGPAEAEAIAIPPGTRWLGLWMTPTSLQGRSGLDIKVRDATGRYFVYNLGPDYNVAFGPGVTPTPTPPDLKLGWNFLVADMSKPVGQGRSSGFGAFFQFVPNSNVEYAATPPQEPLTIISIAVRFIDAVSRVSLTTGAVHLDDLLASTDETLPGNLATERLISDADKKAQPFTNFTVLTDFSPDKWEPIQGILPVKLADEASASRLGTSEATLLQWRPIITSPPQVPPTHGLRPKAGEGRIPVLISEGYLEQRKLSIGAELTIGTGNNYFDVTIVDSYKLFPTLKDPRKEASMVIDLNQLLRAMNGNPRGNITYVNEAWLTDGPDSLKTFQELQNAGKLGASYVSFTELRTAQKKDPLVAAGWEGILFISFAAILILSAIGFLIYSYLTAQSRTLEFAVLRTMGFSRGQIAIVVGFEQIFIISLGMIAGTLMGLRLGSLMIRYMGLTETGEEVLPPLALHVSWLTVGSAWLVLGLVFLVTTGVVVLLYSRLALHRVLRIGEA